MVDATCGNGHDTAFLAKAVGPTGAVFGFDIQVYIALSLVLYDKHELKNDSIPLLQLLELITLGGDDDDVANDILIVSAQDAAVASTTRRLDSSIPAEERPRIHLVQGCHSDMLSHVPAGTAKLVCFNLGYLPSADKSVITQSGTTIAAIEAALEALMPGGLVSIMCYTGHEGAVLLALVMRAPKPAHALVRSPLLDARFCRGNQSPFLSRHHQVEVPWPLGTSRQTRYQRCHGCASCVLRRRHGGVYGCSKSACRQVFQAASCLMRSIRCISLLAMHVTQHIWEMLYA